MGLKVGVLALQGAFAKHIEMLHKLGVETVEVRKPADLDACSGLIIPGGESTTILKHVQFIQFGEPLRLFAKERPIFGTCAGLILMSKEVLGDSMTPFHLLDIKVERNAFGRQAESFQTAIPLMLEQTKESSFPAIFIRAPRIREVGKEVAVLGKLEGEPVLVRQGLHMGCTFHPELSGDIAVHAYFLENLTHK
jgi:5'-phosphate synthase pdxT subunit